MEGESPTENILVIPVLGLGLSDVAVDESHDVRLVSKLSLDLLHLSILVKHGQVGLKVKILLDHHLLLFVESAAPPTRGPEVVVLGLPVPVPGGRALLVSLVPGAGPRVTGEPRARPHLAAGQERLDLVLRLGLISGLISGVISGSLRPAVLLLLLLLSRLGFLLHLK